MKDAAESGGEEAIVSALKNHRRICKIDSWVLQISYGKHSQTI